LLTFFKLKFYTQKLKSLNKKLKGTTVYLR
jgi:hypothetical protein